MSTSNHSSAGGAPRAFFIGAPGARKMSSSLFRGCWGLAGAVSIVLAVVAVVVAVKGKIMTTAGKATAALEVTVGRGVH